MCFGLYELEVLSATHVLTFAENTLPRHVSEPLTHGGRCGYWVLRNYIRTEALGGYIGKNKLSFGCYAAMF